MAAELPTVIDEELLCCPLCLRSLIQPKILPCLHTFCRTCLDKHLIIESGPLLSSTPLQLKNSGILPSKQNLKPTNNSLRQRSNAKVSKITLDTKIESPQRPSPVRPLPRLTAKVQDNHDDDGVYELGELEDFYEDVDPDSPTSNFYWEPSELGTSSKRSSTRKSVGADNSESTSEKSSPVSPSSPDISGIADVSGVSESIASSGSPPKNTPFSVSKAVQNFFKRLPKRKSSLKQDPPKITTAPDSKPMVRSLSSPNMSSRLERPPRGEPPLPKRMAVKPPIPKKPVFLPPPDVIIGHIKVEKEVSTKAEDISRDSRYSAPLVKGNTLPSQELKRKTVMSEHYYSTAGSDKSSISENDNDSLSSETGSIQDGGYLAPAHITTPTETLTEPPKLPPPNDNTVDDNDNLLGNRDELEITYDTPPQTRRSIKVTKEQKNCKDTEKVKEEPATTLTGIDMVKESDKSPKLNQEHRKESETKERQWSNCPICDSAFELPESGIKGLRSNTFITSLQEVVLSQSNDSKKCNNCDRASARFRCLDCRHYLCGGCRDAHNWLKITKHHRVMTLGDLRTGRFQKELTQMREIKCEIHKNNNVDLMCLFCDLPVCYECKAKDHIEHRSGSLDEAADRDRDLLTSLVNTVQNSKKQFIETKKGLNDYETQCDNEKKELIQGLQQQKELLTNRINDCFMDLVQEIERAYKVELESKNKIEFKVNENISHMKYSCDLANHLLTHGKTEDVLLMSKMIKANLNNLLYAVPYVLDTRPFVQFNATDISKPTLVSLFGRLSRRKNTVAQPKRRVRKQRCESVMGDLAEKGELVELFSFRAKTVQDALGCKPTGLTLSTNDDIILVDDINKKVKVYDTAGVLQLELCPQGEDALIDPWDVTITYQGHLAITDKGSRKVKVFDSNGVLRSQFGDHLKSPWGIAANRSGNLIVSDIVAKTVFVNDKDGNLLYPIECKGENRLFMCPEYIAINHNDDIVVSDFEKHCITVFDSQGRFLYQYGKRGSGSQEFSIPAGLCVDKEGNILVADYSNSRIHKISRDGQFKKILLSSKNGLTTPQTISTDSQGNIIIVDGNRVKIFGFEHQEQMLSDSEQDFDKIYEPLKFLGTYGGESTIKFSRTGSESEA